MEFMLETICDIKNNKKRLKEDTAPHTRIKKWLQKVCDSYIFFFLLVFYLALWKEVLVLPWTACHTKDEEGSTPI